MITLQWISTEPYLLKTFVSNRIAEIQSLSKGCEWRHVRTQYNPADLVSRGQTPQEFLDLDIWKNGPHLDYGKTLIIVTDVVIIFDL